MARLIITYPDDMKAQDALCFVSFHVQEGRVSKAGGIQHFCWSTLFRVDGIMCHTRRKKVGQTSDSIDVYRSVQHIQ
jgi:hypothetical protein